MTSRSIITVKEWFFDKIWDQVRAYHFFPATESTVIDGIQQADRTKLRIEEVLGESEKAWKVLIDCETENGHPRTWTAWIPKSVIVEE